MEGATLMCDKLGLWMGSGLPLNLGAGGGVGRSG